MMLANVAIPTFLPFTFASVIGLVFIAAVEAFFLMRLLRETYWACYRASLVANLKSTLVGVPVAWVLWVLGMIPIAWGMSALGMKPQSLASVTLGTTICFGGRIPNQWEAIGGALAGIILLIPFFFASVWIERRVVSKRFASHSKAQVSKAVVLGNVVSYLFFLLLVLNTLKNAIERYPEDKARVESWRSRVLEK
jgi:hypothetical protein